MQRSGFSAAFGFVSSATAVPGEHCLVLSASCSGPESPRAHQGAAHLCWTKQLEISHHSRCLGGHGLLTESHRELGLQPLAALCCSLIPIFHDHLENSSCTVEVQLKSCVGMNCDTSELPRTAESVLVASATLWKCVQMLRTLTVKRMRLPSLWKARVTCRQTWDR